MKPIFSLALGLVAVLGFLGESFAQEGLLLPSEGATGQVMVIPGPAPGRAAMPLFLSPDQVSALQAGGTAGGIGLSGFGAIHIGFDYLTPLWSFRDFTLAVPRENAGSFPLLGDTGHVDNHFAFAPRVDYNYLFTNWDFGVGASGTFYNLSGQLHRELSTLGLGAAQLDANSDLTIISANLVEVTKHLEYRDLKKKDYYCFDCLEDLLIDVSIGARYSSIDQNYTGSLTNGSAATSQTTRYSTQSFSGFGLTTSANFGLPVKKEFLLFTNLRTSLLVGDNKRASTLTVNVAGQPGRSDSISQTNTVFLPVVELEMGFEWQTAIFKRVTDNDKQPFVTLRAAFVGQFWGDVGPLSAGSTQAFRESDLFLVGATVMVGVHF
jgi:hypothetical protein